MAMTRIIYPYSWQNVREHQLSYTLLCKTSRLPWTLTIYLPSGIYRTVKDVIHGMLRGLHNGLRDIYLKSKETDTSLGGNQCSCIPHIHQCSCYLLVGMLRYPRPWLALWAILTISIIFPSCTKLEHLSNRMMIKAFFS